MKRTRVDKLVRLFVEINKEEVHEFVDRLWKELHIFAKISVPTEYVAGFNDYGRLLKGSKPIFSTDGTVTTASEVAINSVKIKDKERNENSSGPV